MNLNKNEDILILENISVDYGNIIGLDSINLNIKKNEIHAIVGDHGSGKSSFVKVISGAIQRTKGRIVFDNKILPKHNPKIALKLGITTIYENIELFQDFNAYENIFFDHSFIRGNIFLDRKKMREKSLEIFHALSLDINPDTPVKYLTISEQRFIELSRFYYFHSKLLIIDEISQKLFPKDLEKFFYVISLLRNEGLTVIYFSSNMNEVINIASRISMINKGRIIETINVSDIDKLRLVQLTYSNLISRKQLENVNLELFYLNNLNKNIINNLPFPIVVSDSKGKIILLNKFYEKLLRKRIEDFFIKSVEDLFMFDDEARKKTTSEEKTFYKIDSVRLKSDDEDIFVNLDIFPLIDEDNAFIGNIFLVSKAGEKLFFQDSGFNFQNFLSYQKNIASIAHEINNPLGIVINYLNIIKGNSSIREIKINLEIMEKEILRMKRIVKRFMHTNEKASKLVKKFVYKDIIEEVALFLKPEMGIKRVNFRLNVIKDSNVEADADLIKQVILNIMINGIESMKDGGDLEVSIDHNVKNSIVFSLIEIKDSGCGIPPEIQDKIFEPFFTTKVGNDARGLGLSLSNDIISGIKGHLDFESDPGRGSVFRIFIPYSD